MWSSRITRLESGLRNCRVLIGPGKIEFKFIDFSSMVDLFH